MNRLALLLSLTGCLWSAVAHAEWPEDSVYNLSAELTDQHAQAFSFDAQAGRPVIMSMFYGSCPHVCPMLISSIKMNLRSLPVAQRQAVRVVMISIDPQRDTPAALQELAERHGLADENWILAQPAASDVRKIAAVLGIKYKQLPDGDFNHTSVMILFNQAGQRVAQSGKLGVPDPEFTKQIAALIGSD